MTDTLLSKATALLEARKKATQGQWAIPHANVFRIIAPDAEHKNPKEGICPPYPWAIIADTDPGSLVGEGHEAHANACFMTLAANIACDTILGYQELLRRMADTLQAMGDFWAYGLDKPDGAEPTEADEKRIHEFADMARKVLEEARAALPQHHTTITS